MLCRLGPLPAKDVVKFCFLLCLIKSQVSIRQNVVLKLRNQERLAVNEQCVPSWCLVENVVYRSASMLPVQ